MTPESRHQIRNEIVRSIGKRITKRPPLEDGEFGRTARDSRIRVSKSTKWMPESLSIRNDHEETIIAWWDIDGVPSPWWPACGPDQNFVSALHIFWVPNDRERHANPSTWQDETWIDLADPDFEEKVVAMIESRIEKYQL